MQLVQNIQRISIDVFLSFLPFRCLPAILFHHIRLFMKFPCWYRTSSKRHIVIKTLFTMVLTCLQKKISAISFQITILLKSILQMYIQFCITTGTTYWLSLYRLSYRSHCRELGCEFCKYTYIYIYIQVHGNAVKYKGILKSRTNIYIYIYSVAKLRFT